MKLKKYNHVLCSFSLMESQGHMFFYVTIRPGNNSKQFIRFHTLRKEESGDYTPVYLNDHKLEVSGRHLAITV